MEIWLNGYYGAGKFALVDDDDFVKLSRHSWHFRDGYAITDINKKEVRMHRYILGVIEPDIVVDHINGNRLDNRKCNLREFTPKQNANNRSNNTKVSAFGETKTIAEWSEDPRCNTTYSVLVGRLKRGIWPEAAILAPGSDDE